MDTTFLYSKPHLSPFRSFLMSHFFWKSVWRKEIKLEEEVVHQEIHLLSSPLQFPFMLLLTLLIYRHLLYCTVLWETFHFYLFCTMFYFYLLLYFALHMAHSMPDAIICLPLCCSQTLWIAEIMGKVAFAEDYLPAFLVSGNLSNPVRLFFF